VLTINQLYFEAVRCSSALPPDLASPDAERAAPALASWPRALTPHRRLVELPGDSSPLQRILRRNDHEMHAGAALALALLGGAGLRLAGPVGGFYDAVGDDGQSFIGSWAPGARSTGVIEGVNGGWRRHAHAHAGHSWR
jgi:hypothetical protein